MTTVKYSQCPETAPLLKTNSIQQHNTGTNENQYVHIYPNPNNGAMQVEYEMPENETGTFGVYDVIGKKLLNFALYGGKNKFSITGSTLNKGVYFYIASAGSRGIAKGKIVVIK